MRDPPPFRQPAVIGQRRHHDVDLIDLRRLAAPAASSTIRARFASPDETLGRRASSASL